MFHNFKLSLMRITQCKPTHAPACSVEVKDADDLAAAAAEAADGR